MPAKARELDNRKDGDRSRCELCNPQKKGTVRVDQVWQATLTYGGSSHRKIAR